MKPRLVRVAIKDLSISLEEKSVASDAALASCITCLGPVEHAATFVYAESLSGSWQDGFYFEKAPQLEHREILFWVVSANSAIWRQNSPKLS